MRARSKRSIWPNIFESVNHGLARKPVAASAAQAAYLTVVVCFLVRYALFVHQEKR